MYILRGNRFQGQTEHVAVSIDNPDVSAQEEDGLLNSSHCPLITPKTPDAETVSCLWMSWKSDCDT